MRRFELEGMGIEKGHGNTGIQTPIIVQLRLSSDLLRSPPNPCGQSLTRRKPEDKMDHEKNLNSIHTGIRKMSFHF